jgi:hypothetical protein
VGAVEIRDLLRKSLGPRGAGPRPARALFDKPFVINGLPSLHKDLFKALGGLETAPSHPVEGVFSTEFSAAIVETARGRPQVSTD